jgi:predicted aspartyl protease
MITGTVNARHEIVIRLPVQNASGTDQEFEFILDTGFNGSLSLPSALIVGLGLTWVTRGRAIMAAGNTQDFDIYAANVIWDGVARPILIVEWSRSPSSTVRTLCNRVSFVF